MTGNTLEKGTTIYECGQPMTALHLITDGKITATYPGGAYQLGKGDVIGVCEICSEVHFLTYTVSETATILTYSFANVAVLDDLLKKHPDIARLFLLSAFYQINALLERCSVSELNCSSLYQRLTEDYERYTSLCSRYRISPRTLSHIEDLTAYLGEEAPDFWLSGYYLGLAHIYSGENYKFFVQDAAVCTGFLRKCSLDFRKAYSVLDEQFRYMQQVNSYYINESGNDLFDFYTSLYYKLEPGCADADSLFADISRIIPQLQKDTSVDTVLLGQRVQSFQNNIRLLQTPASDTGKTEEDAAALTALAGSLNTILEFAGSDLDIVTRFRQHVHSYKLLEDKFAMDDDSCKLRAELTKEFYALYALLFERTLEVPEIPTPVRMFLYFGYVDEELAGISNAVFLYHLTGTITDHSSQGVYTFYDWLLAIFQGRKEPSRNEFDQDYNEYIHKQKSSGNITDAELKALEKDTMAKVNYELQNMFPTVNKVTYGRISGFCPVFTSDDVLKKLEDSYVTVSTLSKALQQIREVDYTAFYRESLDMEHLDILGKEPIHLEFLPDVILMPNVGIRGIMWQEIEGKRRNSPSRMLFSIFHLEDLKLTMIRMAGEFRWELCKRVQGNRWNDISDLSLTSEYFDYIQFYRKNHDLSSEAKERVRSSLQRAKNSFKEMFVRDYIIWIMFEGTGSPRLNKVARRILFTYCPFPKTTCESLRQNPLYAELLSHRDIQTAQKLHHLDVLTKKLLNSGTGVPESLERERMYVEGTITS